MSAIIKRLLGLTLLASTALTLVACQGLGRHWDDETTTLYIDYYKQQCDDEDSSLCFRIREDEDDSWEVADVPFSNFDDFQWGYRYTATVTISYDDSGDPDSYSFDSTQSMEAVSASEEAFSLTLYTNTGILYALDDSSWNLGGEIDFDCSASSSCEALDAAVANSYETELQFVVDGSGGIALDSVICAAAEDDYASDCEGETDVSWYIAPVMSDCGLSEAMLCQLFKVNASGDYELLQLEDGISNWSFSWGYRYHIDVVKTVSNGGIITAVDLDEDDDSPDDRFGSSYKFRIVLRASALPSQNSNFTRYDTIALDCEQYSQCDDIEDVVEDYEDDDDRAERYLLVRVYVDDDGSLIADRVDCEDETTLDAFRSCVEDDYDDVNWMF